MKIFLFILSFLALVAFDYMLPKLYPLNNANNYLLGYESFLKKVEETKGQERIILVGGSSIGWGVSAEKLTSSLNILTLNSGIHAGIGYRNFLRAFSDNINKDKDVLVISPEYSLVSSSYGLGRSNELCEILVYVSDVYSIDCIGYSIRQLFKVTPLMNRKTDLDLSNQYIRQGFNSFGDYVHRVEGQSMIGEMENEDLCKGWDVIDLKEKYIPFIDSLITEGYNVIYIPNFIPSVACSDPNKIKVFHEILHSNFGVEPFLDVNLLFKESYFYNTGYHLTSEGVEVKTEIFLKHLKHFIDSN